MPAGYTTDDVAECAVDSPLSRPPASQSRYDIEDLPQDDRGDPRESALLRAAAARLKPRRARHRPHDHVAPLGLACALLLYALLLVADTNVDLIEFPASSPQSWLDSDVKHALAAVHTSMVELPSEREAAANARLANKTQILLLENRQLAADLGALQADYAELRNGHETGLAELQRSLRRTDSELRWPLTLQDNSTNNLKAAVPVRHAVEPLTSETSPHDKRSQGSDASLERDELAPYVAEVTVDVADPLGSHASSHPESAYSPHLETDRPAVSFVRLIALQFAEGLQDTQKEAILSSKEAVFIVDVDKKLFKSNVSGEPVVFDYNLNISLSTARSELAGPTSGRIRFFPDGTSTGGHIGLELYGSRATVTVDWSTGVASVEG